MKYSLINLLISFILAGGYCSPLAAVALTTSSPTALTGSNNTTEILTTKNKPEYTRISDKLFDEVAKIELSLPIQNDVLADISINAKIKYQDTGVVLTNIAIPFGESTIIDRLLENETYQIEFGAITINNIHYSLEPLQALQSSVDHPLRIEPTGISHNIDTRHFSDVTIHETGLPDTPSAMLTDVRMTNITSGELYIFNIANSQKTVSLGAVKPGIYRIDIDPVNIDGQMYQLNATDTIAILGKKFQLTLPFISVQ